MTKNFANLIFLKIMPNSKSTTDKSKTYPEKEEEWERESHNIYQIEVVENYRGDIS